MPCYLLALLLGTFLGVRAQTIHQRPLARVQLVGSLFSLECTVQGALSPYLYWYRQSLGGAPQLLFSSLSVTQVVPETPHNFTASRPQDGLFILSSKKLRLSDSGFYLCAWSLTLSGWGETSVQKPHPPPEPSLWGWVEDIWVSDCQAL
ncbi:T cell receptor beta variable 30 [Vulpes lagopus]